MNRKIISRIHPVAGVVAFLTILVFWSSSVVSKFSHDYDFILGVKSMILCGMIVLVPAMIIVGGTGFRLAGKSKNPTIVCKKKRMPFIALNGVFILIPCAVTLYFMALDHHFSGFYDTIQTLELLAGAVNFVLLGMSMRDGFKLKKRFVRKA